MDPTIAARPRYIDSDTGEIINYADQANDGEPIVPPQPDVPVVFIRTAYNYDMGYVSAQVPTAIDCSNDPSLTQQQFRDETDINTIVRHFGLTGQLPQQGAFPAYGDFESILTYHDAQNVVRAAAEAFMALPADARARFQNDPQQLMDFAADPANLPELRKLGLTRTLSTPPTPVPATPIPQVGVPAVAPLGTITNT